MPAVSIAAVAPPAGCAPSRIYNTATFVDAPGGRHSEWAHQGPTSSRGPCREGPAAAAGCSTVWAWARQWWQASGGRQRQRQQQQWGCGCVAVGGAGMHPRAAGAGDEQPLRLPCLDGGGADGAGGSSQQQATTGECGSCALQAGPTAAFLHLWYTLLRKSSAALGRNERPPRQFCDNRRWYMCNSSSRHRWLCLGVSLAASVIVCCCPRHCCVSHALEV